MSYSNYFSHRDRTNNLAITRADTTITRNTGSYEENDLKDITFKIEGVDVVNLAGTTSIYVMVPNITTNNLDSSLQGRASSILARIPVNQSANTYLQYVNLFQT